MNDIARYIDADAFEEFIKAKYKDGESTDDIKDQMLFDLSYQPTAFNMDAVVEQMEEKTEFLKDCTKYGNESAEQQEKSYSTMMMYEVAGLVDDLIDIVRNAGKDGAE